MGKRRKTAKTGDKHVNKLKAASEELRSYEKRNAEDDPMYDEVDRYHNAQEEEFLKLDGNYDSDDSSEGEEAVMGLDVDKESSSDDDSSIEDREELKKLEKSEKELERYADIVGSSSDDDDDEDLSEAEDIRDWGTKKSHYYSGDTADLEIGQDEEEAFLEEEAAKDVQSARFKNMTEEDFMLSDTEEETKDESMINEGSMKQLSSFRDISKLTKNDRRKILNKKHPGLLPIVSHFSNIVKDLRANTMVASKALFEGDDNTAELVGATDGGKRYLINKGLIQSASGLNLAIYLLLKSELCDIEGSNDDENNAMEQQMMIQSHPVMTRLQQLNVLMQNLENKVEKKVEGLDEQLKNLVKAAELMKSEAADTNADDEKSNKDEENSASSDSDEDESINVVSDDNNVSITKNAQTPLSSSDSEDEEVVQRDIANDAKFGLRRNEIASDRARNMKQEEKRRKGEDLEQQKRRRQGSRNEKMISDFGEDIDDDADNDTNKNASRSLASTINRIEQRSSSQSLKKRKKSTAAHVAEDIYEEEEDMNNDVRRGIEMMEAELGRLSGDEDGSSGYADLEREENDESDNEDFYSKVKKKAKAKKAFKKSLHEVAPKYPRIEEMVEGERAVNRQILKNRGLVAHKNKLNRNPRVKKREQYRKALIRRKGAVREIRTNESHQYGGELTGIKSGLSRSRKLK